MSNDDAPDVRHVQTLLKLREGGPSFLNAREGKRAELLVMLGHVTSLERTVRMRVDRRGVEHSEKRAYYKITEAGLAYLKDQERRKKVTA